MSNQDYEKHTVTIEKLDKKGSGMGAVWRDTGGSNPRKLKLNVPQTLIGEEAEVTVSNPNRKVARVLADEIIKESPERIEAACPHFELCGGCVWQHWSYKNQLEYKTDEVKRFLNHHGFDTSVVKNALGAENPWEYRNKMEFTFGRDGSLGMHELGNFRKVIDLDTCLIAGDEMVETMLEVSEWRKEFNLSGYDKDQHTGLLRNLMVRQSQKTDELMLAVFATESPDGALQNAVDNLIARITDKFKNVKSLMWMENRDWADMAQSEKTHTLYGRDYINDEMYGYKYRIWFDTFFQTNPAQAEKLVDLAIEMADAKKQERMIDLFCGVGTFSLPFAARVKELAGIEIVESSIESAKRNAGDNGIDNTFFLAKDARRGMDEVLETWGIPDLLMLDPPRSGAGGKVMRRIGRLQTDRVVYVSCNPESFADDITWLREFGYELEQVQPVDLFPHTVHVEVVSILRRIEK
ncbi:23S rRNA (uracil(1939)-C(5))-methyltransferase RlmD [Salinicoccus halodurans]|uniref:23S rRNA m(5)U-1939 methyltransferase n=1 Tax=Salinicoccus halodurans TaxID=407035 RepID=A0A0F7HN91_9STAP|nr:23S rRNA (uracil(1939)-C(5))-methyltransferase RlmD [Salinicoccus halodurans]AKG74513.1 SAM-dependent methlyltransferase [Salinicoccus halodurans]SFK90497.1 23S rRNA m(5)U-1939 methyltransferase [Salinicoccus halodurans]